MKHFLKLFLLLNMGCAKFPEKYFDAGETKIKFSLTVDGKINKDYVYIVAIAISKDVNPKEVNGPLSITEYPWGNGFIGGECTHYIIWKPHSTPPFELYKFLDDKLEAKRFIGSPDVFDLVEHNSKQINFELTAKQLAQGGNIIAEEIKSLKVNFLTMNKTTLIGENNDKIGDSLGNIDPTQRAWITVPLNANMKYDNTYYGSKKPSGNPLDPDLKIIDFSVEINKPD